LGSFTILAIAAWATHCAAVTGAAPNAENIAEPVTGEEAAVLLDAPSVPPPITRKHATKLIVYLEVKEVKARLADGVSYTFWNFGGKVLDRSSLQRCPRVKGCPPVTRLDLSWRHFATNPVGRQLPSAASPPKA
jgi:hypothetical protein